MEPLKTEIEALREVMFTPVEDFVSEKEREEKGEEWAEKTAHRRMFSQGIKAVDVARGERTMWTVCLALGPRVLENFGLYATQAQAEKARTQALTILGNLVHRSSVLPLKNEHGWRQMLELAEKPAPDKGDFSDIAEDARLFRAGWDGKRATRKRFEEAS